MTTLIRPGVNFQTIGSASAANLLSETGTAFVAGLAEWGPTDAPVLIRSMEEFTDVFGGRVAYGYLYDAADLFFTLGGTKLYVVRIVGPAAVKDSYTFTVAGPINTIKVETRGGGAVGWKAAIIAGDAAGEYKIQLTDADGNVLDESYSLVDNDAAVTWGANSRFIRVVKVTATEPAATAATNLANGDDDRASITDTHKIAGIALFTAGLGVGQVYFPGATTTAMHSALLQHAATFNRHALLDATDTDTAATIIAQVDAQRAAANVDVTRGQIFGPWAVVPGLVRRTTRTVPYSIIQAGLIAASDARSGNPNLAVAGPNGACDLVISLTQNLEDDLELLNNHGVTVVKFVDGVSQTYGARTLGNPDAADNLESDWVEASAARWRMVFEAQTKQGANHFAFAQLDGAGHKISEWGSYVSGLLTAWRQVGAVYGASDQEAFSVDVGPSVNTPDTIEDRQLNVVCGVKLSPFAEQVNIYLSRNPIAA